MTVRVLLCQDVEDKGLPVASLLSFLQEQGVEAQVASQLCPHPYQIAQKAKGADQLIVATCYRWEAAGELEEYARRAGVSPLAFQVVPLARICEGDPRPLEKAQASLAMAVLRARAFPGARPENLRPYLLPRQRRITRRALFSLSSLSYRPIPTVHRARCRAEDGCRQCVHTCPHEALEEEGGIIQLRREACTSCGACVMACPQLALEMPGWSPEEVRAELEAALAYGQGRGIAFICPQIAPPGGPWMAVRVPCASAVSVAALLFALQGGAVAVGHCRHQCQSGLRQVVEARLDFCRSLLTALGKDPVIIPLVDATDGHIDLPVPPLQERGPTSIGPIAGAGADAQAILSLTGDHLLTLAHEGAPLGVAQVDESSCTLCSSCAFSCPTGALGYEEREGQAFLSFEATLCIACGQCVESCPERERGAIAIWRGVDTATLREGRKTVAKDEMVSCQRCGERVATAKMLSRLEGLLGAQFSSRRMAQLCQDCRGLPL